MWSYRCWKQAKSTHIHCCELLADARPMAPRAAAMLAWNCTQIDAGMSNVMQWVSAKLATPKALRSDQNRQVLRPGCST